MSENTSTAEKVAGNDDCLTLIMIHLPTKSLLRFKSVSKHWQSLITNPHFVRLRIPDPYSVSGLFFHPASHGYISWDENFNLNLGLEFIPLENYKNPTDDSSQSIRSHTYFPGLSDIEILSSSHGLFLCLGCYDEIENKGGYHILNPSTKQFTRIPERHLDEIEGMTLAYDPSRSPHYKVVSVWSTIPVHSTDPYECQFEIYSSKTGSWRTVGVTFTADIYSFQSGIYWNGTINWLSDRGDSIYVNLDRECLGIMPKLPIPGGKLQYRGESRDHFHMVEISSYPITNQFNVYEMKRDYSEWFLKYQVDLSVVEIAFPEMKQKKKSRNAYYEYDIVSVLREEEEEDSFLVLHLPGKMVSYSPVKKNFKSMCEATWSFGYYGSKTFQYIECLTEMTSSFCKHIKLLMVAKPTLCSSFC